MDPNAEFCVAICINSILTLYRRSSSFFWGPGIASGAMLSAASTLIGLSGVLIFTVFSRLPFTSTTLKIVAWAPTMKAVRVVCYCCLLCDGEIIVAESRNDQQWSSKRGGESFWYAWSQLQLQVICPQKGTAVPKGSTLVQLVSTCTGMGVLGGNGTLLARDYQNMVLFSVLPRMKSSGNQACEVQN